MELQQKDEDLKQAIHTYTLIRRYCTVLQVQKTLQIQLATLCREACPQPIEEPVVICKKTI